MEINILTIALPFALYYLVPWFKEIYNTPFKKVLFVGCYFLGVWLGGTQEGHNLWNTLISFTQ